MPSSNPNPPPLLDAGAQDTGPGPDRESRFSGLVFTIAETCAATKMSRSSIYKLIASNSLPAKKCGARTIILGDDLVAFLRNLPSYPPDREQGDR